MAEDGLIRFPDPANPDEARAYSIGNDGAFSFIPPYMAACYRAAFVYAVWQGAAAVVPPAVYDQTDENGETPRDPDGSLRHPAGAHDCNEARGQNSDMGYPLTVADGNPWAGSDNDGTHLTGPPDRCDINSLAHVVAALVWQELAAIDAGLIESLWRIINVDGQIRAPLMEALGGLGLAQRTLDRCQAVVHGELTDQGTGWWAFHGDHLHARANFFEGETADALAALWGEREQFELDAIKGGDATKPTPGVQPPDTEEHNQPPHTDPPPINPPGPGPASPTPQGPSSEAGGGDGNEAGTVPATPKAPAPAPTREPYLWVFAKPEDIQDGTDPQSLVDACKRFQDAGYNGIMLWDTDLSKPQPWDPYVRANYDALSAWASDAHFSLAAEVCPINDTIEAWWGVSGATEKGDDGGRRYVCLAEPRVHEVYAKILGNVADLFPQGSPLVALMPFYDEFRLQGTHARCRKPGGPLLAAHARKTFELIRAKVPWARPAAWSDCFDPNENATTPYHSVFGGLAGAEAALDPDILILNWDTKGDTEEDAFAFFAGRGHEQIFCGYYDGPGGDGVSVGEERAAIRSFQAKYPGLVGYMYTTWNADYGQLRTYLTADGWARPGGVVAPPGPGTAAPPGTQPTSPNTVLLAHGDPWPDLQPGMTVLLGDGDWRTLSFRGEKGTKDAPITIKAQNPGKVRAAIEIAEGNEWVTWDLR